MLLIGVNRSPYTRRVAISLKVYGLAYEQRDLSGFGSSGFGPVPADTGSLAVEAQPARARASRSGMDRYMADLEDLLR